MTRHTRFHLHADNIVECERTLNLIEIALGDDIVRVDGPLGSPVCPEFVIHRNELPALSFVFLPGFGRWNEDVLKMIRERGGTLREAADAIICGVSGGDEDPLLAIEYCGALPAGNQAWQRNGRAYSFGLAQVPYLYVAELGGFELDSSRNRKAARMPNPAVPFSYLAYSLERNTPVFPVFVTSPGADEVSRELYSEVFAEAELVAVIRSILLGEDLEPTLKTLREKVLSVVKKRAASSRKGETLSSRQWIDAHQAVENGDTLVEHLLANHSQPWSKTAYIAALTDTAKSLMAVASQHAVGLSSTKLPICVVSRTDREAFAASVKLIYSDLPPAFLQWLERDEELVICWVMGFKPRGDDARPDRGLPPFARMLAGQRHDLLTIVYGPAKKATWPLLMNNPQMLVDRNGLWEAILDVSDALLVDASTDKVTKHGFVREHWLAAIPTPKQRSILVEAKPSKIGENDVDTVLHLLLARFAGENVFEGMCNPPGGDWSGVSLRSADRSVEMRWVSLPRVSGADTKRPDHVFEFFGISAKPVILSIESKETPNAVEQRIGPRLIAYLMNLIASPASIERPSSSSQWQHSSARLRPSDFQFLSAVAYISSSEDDIRQVRAKASADLLFAFRFAADGQRCSILIIAENAEGRRVANAIGSIDLKKTGIKIEVRQ
jgi:hypothetical protein